MKRLGLSGAIAHYFIDSKLTPLIIVACLLLGVFAILKLPREEEPQIIVPMVDVFVQMPGASAKEVEERITKPMEKLLWEIPGVEYIYTTSSPGMSMAVVRFYVGRDMEESIVKVNTKLSSNFDRIPHGGSYPLIKVRSIDDVPILALTVWSTDRSAYELRRMTARLEDAIKQVPDVSETHIIGGPRRALRVIVDPERAAARGLTVAQLQPVIARANAELEAASFASGNVEYAVRAGAFVRSPEDLKNITVGAHGGRPVLLKDVADIVEGPEERTNYVSISAGPAAEGALAEKLAGGKSAEAVTLTVAKRQGTNAIVIGHQVLEKLESVRGQILPSDVHVTITRNYGETAAEKSNELLFHMAIAVVSVSLLIMFALGKREAGVVAIAVPVTLALTLLVFYLYGYTLNRITLFALIFSIGILVDDAIVVVENIVRHFRMPSNRGRSMAEVASEAVDEVGNPTILATFTVIAAILPMAFVGGLMGPYMRPIPVGASAAMLFSLAIAFVISPWASLRLLTRSYAESAHGGGEQEGYLTRLYRRIMTPMIEQPSRRNAFFSLVAVLLVGAIAFIPLKWVTVKMLPFDNKSEFQVIVNTPEGTTLEETAAVARRLKQVLVREPEVTDVEMYAGTAAPYNFNGLVRHWFLRQGPNVADLQVNLIGKHHRKAQSHDIAKRVRPRLEAVAREMGATIQVAEVPPGPPVMQTLVAEIYGPDYERQIEIAREVKRIFETTEGVTDVDWYVEDLQPQVSFHVDRRKAALNGVSAEDVARTVAAATGKPEAGLAHIDSEVEDVPITVELPRPRRSGIEQIASLRIAGRDGRLVPLGEIVDIRTGTRDRNIYHKNLMPVVYVTGDVTGRQESPVYAILKMRREIAKIKLPEGYELKQYSTRQPFTSTRYAMKWDGEWHITYEVFRDLGIAFAAVLILIYVLVVGWFQSFRAPLVIMAPIPLTLVGILPAHAMMGAFFTATSMIGFIAGAGIIVRNSIILVDFIELRRRQGMPLAEAVVDAGAVRFRPMLLTASAVLVGAFVILFDPIFQGLAISLMAGEIASTLLSRMAVPVLYYLAEKDAEAAMKAAQSHA